MRDKCELLVEPGIQKLVKSTKCLLATRKANNSDSLKSDMSSTTGLQPSPKTKTIKFQLKKLEIIKVITW